MLTLRSLSLSSFLFIFCSFFLRLLVVAVAAVADVAYLNRSVDTPVDLITGRRVKALHNSAHKIADI